MMSSIEMTCRHSEANSTAGSRFLASFWVETITALALDKALAGTGLQADQHGLALLDRARAAEAQGDLKTARAKITEATKTISEDPYLWFFSAALAVREEDIPTAKVAINRALAMRMPALGRLQLITGPASVWP